MKSLVAMAAVALMVLPCAALAAEAQTAAPPAVQQEIRDFLAMIGRSQYQCQKPSKPKVLSSEISEDAVIESGQLVSGKTKEVWVSRMCGPKVKYLFTISPDAAGQLKLSGFEPVGEP